MRDLYDLFDEKGIYCCVSYHGEFSWMIKTDGNKTYLSEWRRQKPFKTRKEAEFDMFNFADEIFEQNFNNLNTF